MSEQEEFLKRIADMKKEFDQHKELEKSLRESEEIYKAISQKSFAAIYVVQNGMFCNVNANMSSYTGYSQEELIGMKANSIVHPEDRQDVIKKFLSMLRGEYTNPYVFRIITKRGDIRWITETVSSITYGDRSAILGIAMDITEHRLTIQKLWESVNLYRTIFETTGTATIIIEEDTTISLVNSEFINATGYHRKDVEGKESWVKFVVPEDLERMLSYHKLRRTNREAAPRNYEFRFIDSWGRIRNVVLTINMIPGTKKSVASFVDITEHKLAINKIQESENLYRTIFETTGAATMIIEEDTTISLVNSELVNATGYRREDVEGKKSWTEFVVPEDLERMLSYHKLRRTNREAAPRNYEFRLIDSWGRIRNVVLTINMIPDTKKSVASLVDITEQKLAVSRIQESENLYRTIFENTGTATIIIEDDMTISLANTEFEALSGAPKKYWEGKRKWTELFNKKDIQEMIHYHQQRMIDSAASPRNYQCNLMDKQGNKKVVLVAQAMIPGSKKSVVSLSDITEQKRTEASLRKREQEIQKKSRNLEEVNTALKILLKQRDSDKQELEEKVLSNIKRLVMPYLQKLKANRSDPRDLSLINILEANLMDVISPFSQRLSSNYMNLTPKELQVANLIKEGKSTKEIADMMVVSEATVSLHRDHIRKKLGLNNKKINLTSYLLSLS